LIVAGILVSDVVRERFAGETGFLTDPLAYIDIIDQKETGLIAIQPVIEENYFLSSRVDLWSAGLSAYVSAPLMDQILGLGTGTFADRIQVWKSGFIAGAHNMYVSSLVETGLFGLALLLMWTVVVFKMLFTRIVGIGVGKEKQLAWAVAAPMFLGLLAASISSGPFHDMRGALCAGLYLGVGLGMAEKRRSLSAKTGQESTA
jgi:O-antigen ligase